MRMYWFIFKHIVSQEETLPCTLPGDLLIIPSSITYYHVYKKVDYLSPQYKSLGEMLKALHEVILQIDQHFPIFYCYNDGQYMEDGRAYYKAYKRLRELK